MPKTFLTPTAKTRICQDAAQYRVIYGPQVAQESDDDRDERIAAFFDAYMTELLLKDGNGCAVNELAVTPVITFRDGLCFPTQASDFMLDNKAPGMPGVSGSPNFSARAS